jgi:hypothetical protein
MRIHWSVILLLRGLLFYWAAWLTAVAATNILDLLQSWKVLSPEFKFVSGNGAWIAQVMQPLAIPAAVQTGFYLGAIIWESLAAILFWRAVRRYRGLSLSQESAVFLAFGVNLALWGAFQILDEVFLAYQPEAVHRTIFANQLLTILIFACCRSEPAAE